MHDCMSEQDKPKTANLVSGRDCWLCRVRVCSPLFLPRTPEATLAGKAKPVAHQGAMISGAGRQQLWMHFTEKN